MVRVDDDDDDERIRVIVLSPTCLGDPLGLASLAVSDVSPCVGAYVARVG